MRISNSMITNKVLANLNNNSEKLNELYEQAVSGKLFVNPSDDASGFIYSMKLDSWISNNEQYQSNIESCNSWLSDTDDALDSAGDILEELEDLGVQAANDGTLTEDERENILVEVEELEKELINIANTQQGDSYLFSGTATTTESFDEDGEYQGDYNSIVRQVNSSSNLEININGQEAFADAFEAFHSLEDALEAGDAEALSTTVLSNISEATNTINTCRAEVGAKENRLEFTQKRLENENTSLNKILSNNEDIDLATAYTNYATQQYVYEAALSVSSTILQTSLVNFVSS
ncbi:flagellar hook-associated protein 3 [Iocasia frigidifontis]|uniref:Flagellar hook-associated protein 3 n=1 Tax=Iocasia fonsfrigidae TaxID=2682810 RepID=A0A8A7KGX2_9FIRM|nr:flagellar hook-associated protein FlgL [Iocasia fonsfrigidae]QTL98759.1 flagellar hook-associated protein 3 [Iocasia fonsfrigidae]